MTELTTVTIDKMYGIDTVLVKVAARCNINCDYCYVFNMGDTNWEHLPNVISNDTVERVGIVLKELIEKQKRPIAVVLHGGEPLLLGSNKLEKMLSILRSYIPVNSTISIQTNATLLTNEILDICSKYRTSISVSLDGPESVHDKNRIGFDKLGTFKMVMKGIHLLQAHEDTKFLFSGVLAVIEPKSDPQEMYYFFKEIMVPSVDFLNRDGNHSVLPYGKESFESIEYGSWLSKLFDIYLDDEAPIPVRILDDTTKLIIGGESTKEGVGINDFGILVIDTDGTITKNDTLKSSFDGADRFGHRWTVYEDFISDIVKFEEYQVYHEMQIPKNPTCLNCELLNVCGGGMLVHRFRDKDGYDNPTVYCNDNKHLIKHITGKIQPLLKDLIP